jgi:hypothetical protein
MVQRVWASLAGFRRDATLSATALIRFLKRSLSHVPPPARSTASASACATPCTTPCATPAQSSAPPATDSSERWATPRDEGATPAAEAQAAEATPAAATGQTEPTAEELAAAAEAEMAQLCSDFATLYRATLACVPRRLPKPSQRQPVPSYAILSQPVPSHPSPTWPVTPSYPVPSHPTSQVQAHPPCA